MPTNAVAYSSLDLQLQLYMYSCISWMQTVVMSRSGLFPACFTILLLILLVVNASADILTSMVSTILQHPNYTQPGCSSGCCFFCWGYCGGLVLAALGEALDSGGLSEPLAAATSSALNAQLDYYLRTPGQPGYSILHGLMKPDGDCGE